MQSGRISGFHRMSKINVLLNNSVGFVLRSYIYVSNTSWIMAEKILSLAFTFLATVLLARHLGPESFGILSYATSIIALAAICGHVGLSSLVVRDLVRTSADEGVILGTTLALKGVGYFLGFGSLLVYALITTEPGESEREVLIILSLILLLKPFDVVDFWFQSKLKIKYVSISKMISMVATTIMRLVLIYLGMELVFFAAVNVVYAFIIMILMLIFYFKKSSLGLLNWRASWSKAIEFMSQGWMVFLGSIFAVIYLKVDQVMLKWMIGTRSWNICGSSNALRSVVFRSGCYRHFILSEANKT